MAEISLVDVSKLFGRFQAVQDVSLEIQDSEMVCLLGPSGCGKTTTLRLIAGFEKPSDGHIYIGGRLVSSPNFIVPPEKRNLGMVFQNYAVWPHMTVFENVAYPLKLRKVPKKEIYSKVMEILAMVGLEGLEQRYPEQLSGGQQQRVALARALVVKPNALLLDEPLSNLDAKLRERMRFEITELQHELRITTVYVTHDQAEAMVLSDRIVIMNQGRIVQIGRPMDVYRNPGSPFVADFLGLANFVPALLIKKRDGEGLAEIEVEQRPKVLCKLAPEVDGPLPLKGTLFVRPEDIDLRGPNQAPLQGKISRITFLGSRLDVRVKTGEVEWRLELPVDEKIREGDCVTLEVKHAIFFKAKGGEDEGKIERKDTAGSSIN